MKDKISDVIKYIDGLHGAEIYNVPQLTILEIRQMLQSILSEEKDRGIIISQDENDVTSDNATIGHRCDAPFNDNKSILQ